MQEIHINSREQSLKLFENNQLQMSFLISTAKNGMGEIINSEMTPRGRHRIRAKIGGELPANAVLVGRRFTGEIFHPQMRVDFPERDWILTRILWLCGCEVGKNRLGEVDSMRRYIYIHGTPDDVAMGQPGSRGCIRMRNSEIIELFDRVHVGTHVVIE